MSIVLPILITIHVIICLLLVLIVMMQRPKSEGLGAAFGSGMTENIFGAQTTNVLSKFTVWLATIFFILTLVLAMIYARRENIPAALQKELMPATNATAPAQPVPSASPATQP